MKGKVMKNTLDYCLLGLIVCIGLGLMGFNAVRGWAECPNFGTESVRCPDAPPDYDNGDCGLQFVGGVLTVKGGMLSASNVNILKENVEGYAISSNQSTRCYRKKICGIAELPYSLQLWNDMDRIVGLDKYRDGNVIKYSTTTYNDVDYFPSYEASPCAG